MIARLARAVSRFVGIPLGRKGVHVRRDGVHVLLKATEFRNYMTPANAQILARHIEKAAWEANAEATLRAAAAAGGAP